MSSRLREIASSALGRFGLPGIADVHICSGTSGAPFSYWEQFAHADKQSFHTTISAALGLMTTGRNDVLLLTPDSHTQAVSLAWNKNLTHLVGMYPPAMLAQRARIGHSANFDKLLDVSGYGNLFANLYLMYGRGDAANLTCLNISGNRNSFINCHFAAPMNATEGDEATFKVINMTETSGGDGLEHYFKGCTIGVDTAIWTNGDMIKYAGTPRLVFEDCIFLTRLDNGQVTVIDGTAGDGNGFILFKNCIGVNTGTAMTVAIGSTGLAAATRMFIQNSWFLNCTDVIAAASEAQVFAGMYPAAAADDIFLGLGQPVDHTA